MHTSQTDRTENSAKTLIGFVFNVEAGPLEEQALLLTESIRSFAGHFNKAPIWIVQPRKGGDLRSSTLNRFMDLEAYFIRANLNSPNGYKFLNKPLAAALIEEMCGHYVEQLVYLDTDTLILNEPKELILRTEDIALRPVDKINIGSPVMQEPDPFWSKLYEICQVSKEAVWPVRSTFDRQSLRGYFQGGVISVNPIKGIFSAWRDHLIEFLSYENTLSIVPSKKHRFYMEQACLAATVLGRVSRNSVKLLGPEYNYPLHKQADLSDPMKIKQLGDIAIAHYHHAFSEQQWWKTIEVGSPYKTWLKKRLPLKGANDMEVRIKRQLKKWF